MAGLVLWDLDGTLLICERNYQRRINIGWFFLDAALDADVPTVHEYALKVEEENTRLVKVAKDYNETIFPESLVSTYRYFAKRADIPVKRDIEERLRRLGATVFRPETYSHSLLDGAVECLERVIREGDKQVLFTKGPEHVQYDKVVKNGLLEYFPCPEIVPMKYPEDFLRMIAGYDPADVINVGNSVLSDINPATALGIRSIHVKREEWLGEHDANGIERKEMVIQIKRLRQFLDVYPTCKKEWARFSLMNQYHQDR